MRYIEGRNPVREALKAGTDIKKILIQQGIKKQSVDFILCEAHKKGIPVIKESSAKIERISETRNPQGIIAEAEDFKYVDLDNLLRDHSDPPLFLVLDQIQDPQNLGSILRTAETADVDGVIIPKRRAAQITPLVGKVSSGAVEHLSVCRVTNIARTIENLKEHHIWVFGTSIQAENICYNVDLDRPLALVIGSEGKGMRRLVQESCDMLVKLPSARSITSLNAGVAAGIFIYETLRQRLYN